MQYKHLGTTGMAVSAFCMGTMTFGREASAEESKAMFDLAREAGINFIDTANIYSTGGSEALVG
jgi:aryl-alcohol dehydrogenase-like predicted oxidoreductase